MPASLQDIVAMVYFSRVVEARSFTAAAAKLGVSKSAVSTRISELEARLGTRLLNRTTRRLALTADGLAFFERCARITADADEATAVAEGATTKPRGLLRVNAPATLARLYLTDLVAEYLACYTDVRIELIATDRFVDLAEEGVDVAIRVSSKQRDSGLVQRKLATDRLVVCAAPAYIARRGAPSTPAELVHHDCLRYALLKAHDEWRFHDPSGPTYSVPVEGRFVAADGTLLRKAVLSGMGIAVLPYFAVARDVAAERITLLLEEFALARLTISAMYLPARVLPPKVRAFVDALVAHFRTPPWDR